MLVIQGVTLFQQVISWNGGAFYDLRVGEKSGYALMRIPLFRARFA